MPKRLVGASPPALIPALMAMAINTPSTPARRAIGIPTGASTSPACGDPIAATLPVSVKNTNGNTAGRRPKRATAAAISRSIVPFTWAMPKK